MSFGGKEGVGGGGGVNKITITTLPCRELSCHVLIFG